MTEPRRGTEFDTFTVLSARLGSDPLLVQAAGGNTSIKVDGVLWIKASGRLLRSATAEDIFVPVDLAKVRAGVAEDAADPTAGTVLGTTALRPSIETTLHALLPQRVVLHLHSVNALASVVCDDGRARVTARLAGLPWTYLDYHRPGLPLTRAVRDAIVPGVSVLVLGNHGIVVGADDCAAAEALGNEVERRLELPAREAPRDTAAGLGAVATATGYRAIGDRTTNALATAADCLARARGGVLYPDHVVFLGGEACVAESAGAAEGAIAAFRDRVGSPPACVLVDGAGVLVAAGAPAAAEEMLRCQADVLLRVTADARLRYLSQAEVGALLNWDAEKFRRSAAH